MTPHTTADRGYGAAHQRLRAQLLPTAYGQPCHLCGRPMLEGQALDLDHTPDRGAYRGMTHARCNRRDGGKRGAKTRSKQTTRATSRRW